MTISLRWRDGALRFAVPTSSLHTFQLATLPRLLMEMDDIHFHFDSAVLLAAYDPEPRDRDPVHNAHISALAVIRACYLHAESHQDQRLLICGHADRSGAAAYNVTLSRERAESTLHLLRGEQDPWADLAMRHHRTEDHQQILAWIARDWAWDCDPGPITNADNPRTQRALRSFKARYNLEFSGSLNEQSAAMDRDTWRAFFDMYVRSLEYFLRRSRAELAQLRTRLRFVGRTEPAVGCGESFPIEQARRDGFRSRTNRRVELNFFQDGQEPRLDCQPGTQCVPDACEVYNAQMYVPAHVPVPPVSPRIIRFVPVHLQLAWRDPEDRERPLPEGVRVFVRYADGSEEEQTLAPDGRLRFEAPRDKGSFTLRLAVPETFMPPSVFDENGPAREPYFIVSPPSDGEGPELLRGQQALESTGMLRRGHRITRLPEDFDLANCTWAVTNAATYERPEFRRLREPDTFIGTDDTPARAVLLPRWQYIKLVYFDRLLRRQLIVPTRPEALRLLGFGGGTTTESNWTVDRPHGCQCVPWIRQDPPRPDAQIDLMFMTPLHSYIESQPSGGRVIVSGTAHDQPDADRLRFSDLPGVWTAHGFVVRRADGRRGRFEDMAAEGLRADDPLIFHLDDLVLVDENDQPIAWTPAQRAAVFDHQLQLHRPNLHPESHVFESFHSQLTPPPGPPRNYITDYPDGTRLVIAGGNVYSVFADRTNGGHGSPTGARAAKRLIDSARSVSSGATGSVTRRSPFFTIVTNYQRDQHYYGTLGRSDLCWLRCCDVDGGQEQAVAFPYFRLFFDHQQAWTQAQIDEWDHRAAQVLEREWNLGGRVLLVPQPAGREPRYRVRWFVQPVDNALRHTRVQIKSAAQQAGTRSNMGQDTGEWADTDVNTTGGATVAVHEGGHASSLSDEYLEHAKFCSFGNPGFIDYIEGSPYSIDTSGMMAGNTSIRARYYWHLAEWLHDETALALMPISGPQTSYQVQRATDPAYTLPRGNGRPYTNWPYAQRAGANNGGRGRFDVVLSPLGPDEYSQGVLRAGKRFNGLLNVIVRLRLTFHTSDYSDIDSFLDRVTSSVLLRFREELTLKVRTDHFDSCFLRISPRYLVTNFANTDAYRKMTGAQNAAAYTALVNQVDTDAPHHYDVIVRDDWPWNERRQWDATGRLHYEYDSASSFWEFFAEMLGLRNAERPTAANLTGIAGLLDNGRIVAM